MKNRWSDSLFISLLCALLLLNPGTILGATEMVTGFAPNNLLMTSA